MAQPLMTAPEPVAESTLWKGTPSPTLLAGHIALIIAVLVLLPLFIHFFASTMPEEERAAAMVRFGWIATGVLVAIQLVALTIAWIRLRSTAYTVTNQRVLIEQGVFSRTLDEIDLRYVDDSQFTQSFVARVLGIGDVTMLSSDQSSPRYVLRSIRDPRGVREIIRAEAYRNSQRQIFTRST
jgi:uncharacterized membrane protein YdbT with pleckstrin-like domain